MRAICEACDLPQPIDWRAGDLCVHCGKAARTESRCFWCTKWTPEGKFCRHCGAETVDERVFGAARMLKEAGTDRFTVPKLLRELPADQIDNFTNIYQRHATVLARHVEDLLFLEKHLHQKHWSIELEDKLIAELPWSDDDLKHYSISPISPIGDLDRAREIHRITPIETTRYLAGMVLLRLGLDVYKPLPPQYLGNDLPITMSPRMRDVPPGKELLAQINEALNDPDAGLRAEAALTLSNWRVLYSFGFPENRRPILEALAAATIEPAATVGRALLGEKLEIPSDYYEFGPTVGFSAALTLGDEFRLTAAMQGDRLERLAAGLRLIDLEVYGPLADTLRTADPDTQWQLLRGLSGRRSKTALPELRDVFYELMESSEYDRIREIASRLLSMDSGNVDAMRILRAVENDRSGLQSLLQSDLSTEDAVAVAAHLVQNGGFRMSQFGISDLAEKAKVPDDFVIRQFPLADEETRKELCQFAEVQLIERGDDELHGFMVNVVLGPYSAEVRTAAWWGLCRWYGRHEYASTGPLKVSKEPIERFFGSIETFLERLIAVLSDPVTLKEVGYAEFMSKLLKYHDDEVLPELVKEERLSMRLRDVLVEVMQNPDLWSLLRSSAADFLGLLAMNDEWLVDIFRMLLGFKGTDMEGASIIVLDRLCREYEDLGEGEGRNPPKVMFDYQALMERDQDDDLDRR